MSVRVGVASLPHERGAVTDYILDGFRPAIPARGYTRPAVRDVRWSFYRYGRATTRPEKDAAGRK